MAHRVAPADDIRTFCLVGHRSSGKTSVAEMLLHVGGAVRKPGSVDEGTALLDHLPLERTRHVGMVPSLAWVSWRDRVLYFADVPGSDAVPHPRALVTEGVDLTIVVISAPDGVEHGAEAALWTSRHADRSLLVVINKIDRDHDLDEIVGRVGELSGQRPVLLHLPWIERGALVGLIDVLAGTAHRYLGGESTEFVEEPVPEALHEALAVARERAHEAATLGSDELLEHYLEHFELTDDRARAGLHAASEAGKVALIALTAATLGVGGADLLDAVAQVAPDPRDWVMPAGMSVRPRFVAQWIGSRFDDDGAVVAYLRVWSGPVPANALWRNGRTGETVRVRKLYRARGPRRASADPVDSGAVVATWDPLPGLPGDAFSDVEDMPLVAPKPGEPMTWLWVRCVREGKHPQLVAAVEQLRKLDPSLRWSEEPHVGGVRLGGLTRAQLDLARLRLEDRFGLELIVDLPPVRYLERPAASVREVHGLHCKRKGSEVVEYGECWIDLEPTPPELGFQFVGEVHEDVLPTRFVPPIGEGARRALAHGPTAGYPVSGVLVRCERGEYDALESVEVHFEHAGERAMQAALLQARTELMEPWSEVRVFCGSEHVGPVLADLNAHRGRVLGLEVSELSSVVQAHLPNRELLTLAGRLEALTGGRAWFDLRASHYDRLPNELVGEAIARSPYQPLREVGEPAGARR